MKKLPDSKVYEQELKFMPYKDSLKEVLDYLIKKSPKNGKLLDTMCGPGYLLGKIQNKRKDLQLTGVDIDKRYIAFSKKKYPNIQFELGDALSWKSKELFDVVVCTGSVHHIPYQKQEIVIKNISLMLKPNGLVIISDCYVDDYLDEVDRKTAASKLGYEYLKETILNGAPKKVIEATIDIIYNDVLMNEFKTSIKKRTPIIKKYFRKIKTLKTWPKIKSEYGDYIMICRK